MQRVSSEVDINDAFINILCLEDNVFKESYESGYKIGAAEGNVLGFHLGYHRGAEIGAELGYYSAVARVYLQKLDKNKEASDKIINNLKKFEELLKSFPQTNVEVDIVKLLDDIRVKFKKIRSQLKIDARFPTSDNLSF